MKLIKKRKKVLVVITITVFSLLAGLFILLLIISPGKPEKFLNDEGEPLAGSLSEKIFVDIGGVKQGMFIRSKNTDLPVLLYVHGGPGFPNYFLFDKYQPALEDYFTVCYWEQRGGGLSYRPDMSYESITLEQYVSDAIEVSNYLSARFGKRKIYIMAHSGGSPMALLAVQKEPQRYHAYIAMAQITHQIESEKIAYQQLLQWHNVRGNRKTVKKFLQYRVMESDSNVLSFFRSPLRDQVMHEMGVGTMRSMNSIFRDIFIPVWTCRAYTLKEKWNIWRSKILFLPKTGIHKEILETNYTECVPEIQVPIYFISGKHDLTVNVDLSKAFFKQINAPLKGFYTFENSAHSPLFEEPEKFREILVKDVLKGGVSCSDDGA